jgi:GxxExxY protein
MSSVIPVGQEKRMLEPPPELDVITSAVIGAALEVHRLLGPGFLESVYEEAMAVELELRGVAHERQKAISVSYKGHAVGEGRTDFLVENSVIVELKAADRVLPIHRAQVLSYLKTTGCRLGLLINFHEALLTNGIRRVVLSETVWQEQAQFLARNESD